MHIRWGNTFSTSFCVSNGVKQGGIISPVLFNVYMDDPRCALNRSNIGGRIGGEIVNHLSYADDLLSDLPFISRNAKIVKCVLKLCN